MLISLPPCARWDASVSARFAAGCDGAGAFEGERRTLQLVGILQGDLCSGSQDGNGRWDERGWDGTSAPPTQLGGPAK